MEHERKTLHQADHLRKSTDVGPVYDSNPKPSIRQPKHELLSQIRLTAAPRQDITIMERSRVQSPPAKPLMIFDGDCRFCVFWIRRWQRATGEAVEYLRWMKNQIYQNYKKFTGVTDVPERIQTLDVYWESYVDLLDTYRRRKNHMRSINRQTIQNQIQQAERAVSTAPDDDTGRLYQTNLEFLQKRMRTYDDMERSMRRVEAQLQSIESFFGLVNDQVVTMPTPEHISSLDFESLLSSIELTKEILDETAPIMSQLDVADRSSSQQVRPPLAQRQ